MYLGKIVEGSTVRNLFHDTKHPYTQGLMNSIPSLATKRHRLRQGLLSEQEACHVG
ncbi:hypothetical protein LM599_01925 [Candidatus Acetothermia bacterium]|nr:hypothetical protein [Candidatus Acetothermia bacterium]